MLLNGQDGAEPGGAGDDLLDQLHHLRVSFTNYDLKHLGVVTHPHLQNLDPTFVKNRVSEGIITEILPHAW